MALLVAACGQDAGPFGPSAAPTVGLTAVPGTDQDGAAGTIFLGGLEIEVDPAAAATPRIDEEAAVEIVRQAVESGEVPVIGAPEAPPPLHIVATGFVPGLVRILGAAGTTDVRLQSPTDAWVVVIEGQGTDGRYTGAGVVGQDGKLLSVHVSSPASG